MPSLIYRTTLIGVRVLGICVVVLHVVMGATVVEVYLPLDICSKLYVERGD